LIGILLLLNFIERNGLEFFRLTCEHDLEGIVAKLKHGRYGEGWFKIRNPRYSQREERRDLFERRNAR
jgi:ATP-dependent DNA ligase